MGCPLGYSLIEGSSPTAAAIRVSVSSLTEGEVPRSIIESCACEIPATAATAR